MCFLKSLSLFHINSVPALSCSHVRLSHAFSLPFDPPFINRQYVNSSRGKLVVSAVWSAPAGCNRRSGSAASIQLNNQIVRRLCLRLIRLSKSSVHAVCMWLWRLGMFSLWQCFDCRLRLRFFQILIQTVCYYWSYSGFRANSCNPVTLCVPSQVLGPRPQSGPHGGPEVHLGRLRLPAGHDRTRHHQASHGQRLAARGLHPADAISVLCRWPVSKRVMGQMSWVSGVNSTLHWSCYFLMWPLGGTKEWIFQIHTAALSFLH